MMDEKGRRKLIKICGITTEKDIEYVNAFLPDFAGFVLFYPKSFRNLELSEAQRLQKQMNPLVKSVAVVVSPTGEQIEQIQAAGFDYVQIHGDMHPEVYETVQLPVLRAFNGKDMETFARWKRYGKIVGYVFDSGNPGSGETFDWSLMESINRDEKLLFLAGGIHEGNVREAIRQVNPDGIDVSSSVEWAERRMRGKDPEKMKKMIRMVHDEQ